MRTTKEVERRKERKKKRFEGENLRHTNPDWKGQQKIRMEMFSLYILVTILVHGVFEAVDFYVKATPPAHALTSKRY